MEFSLPVPPDDIWSGREPSIEAKRQAKIAAWGNGARPLKTFHRIALGDSRKLPIEPAGDVHLVVTSPPYFNVVEYEASKHEAQLGHYDDYDAFLNDLDNVWTRCFERLVPGGRMCVVVGDVCIARRKQGRHHVIPLHSDIAVRCRRIGFDYLTPIFWSKIANTRTEVGGTARFLGKPYEPNGIIKNDVEYILMLRKPGNYRKPTSAQRALSILDRDEHDRGYRGIWSDIRGQNRADGHPAPFPIALAERLIRLFSFVGDTVLDPFWGSGTTSLAAARAARSSIGYEIEKTYLQIGKRRAACEKTEIVADFMFDYGGG